MICQPCRDRTHNQCQGGTWCDCQHQTGQVVYVPHTPTITNDQPGETPMEPTDDLITFLKVRFGEDEQIARAATAGPWIDASGNADEVLVEQNETLGHLVADLPTCDDHTDNRRADAEHIARHHPARVLREAAAKRRLLRMVEHALADDSWDETAKEMAQTLAFPYADHPDYQASWRP